MLINRAMKCLCGESEFKQIKIEALLTSSVTYSIVKGLWGGGGFLCVVLGISISVLNITEDLILCVHFILTIKCCKTF